MPKVLLPLVGQAVMNATEPTMDLRSLRQALDGVDVALAGLLICRASLSRQAQAVKVQAGVPILDAVREAEVRRRYDRTAPGSGLVAQAILNWCRNEH